MDWMSVFGFDKLDLRYEASCEGMDGECFHYLVDFDAPVTEKTQNDVMAAIEQQMEPLNDEEKDLFPGEVWLSEFGCENDNQLDIELDLGNCHGDKFYQDQVIQSILLALNDVSGVRSVIVNQGCDDFEM